MKKLIFYKRRELSRSKRDMCFYLEKEFVFDKFIPLEMYINIGISICHPDDKFVKKIGRELAIKKCQQYKLDLCLFSDDFVDGKAATYTMVYSNRYVLDIKFDIETSKIIYIDLME